MSIVVEKGVARNGDLRAAESRAETAGIAGSNAAGDEMAAAGYKVIRRNGSVMEFDRQKIIVALTKAFLEVMGGGGADSASVRTSVETTADRVIDALRRRKPLAGNFHIEDIQDQVELALMRAGHQKVAREYVIYREKRAKVRQEKAREMLPQQIRVTGKAGITQLDVHNLQERMEDACRGLEAADSAALLQSALREMYDGIKEDEVYSALYLAARAQIEREPSYSQASARLLLDSLRLEIFEQPIRHAEMKELYPKHFADMIRRGWTPNCWTRVWPKNSTLSRWAKNCGRSATCNSAISACKLFLTATSSTSAGGGWKCRSRFLCGWRWGWRWTKNIPTPGRRSFTNCCRRFRL